MATITFLSPRRGSGTTTALAAAADALANTKTDVTLIDRTENQDLDTWWPSPLPIDPTPDADMTLVDAHSIEQHDHYVCTVYDPLTTPNIEQWIDELTTTHPNVEVIAAIANRTVAEHRDLILPGNKVVPVKPLPLHLLLHEAALDHQWPLSITAANHHEIMFPALALSTHLTMSLRYAEGTATRDLPIELLRTHQDEHTESEPTHTSTTDLSTAGLGGSSHPPTPIDTSMSPADRINGEISAAEDVANSTLSSQPATATYTRHGVNLPDDVNDHMALIEPTERRHLITAAIATQLASPSFAPVPNDTAHRRVDHFWSDDAHSMVAAAARAFGCAQWRVVSAVLRNHFAQHPPCSQ